MAFSLSINKKQRGGFTLIELLVSMSIIAFIAALSISAYPKFSTQLAITSDSYKILAYLKETQSYGISSYTVPGQRMVYGFSVSKSGGIQRVKIENPTDTTNQYYVGNVTNDTDTTSTFNVKNIYEIVGICYDLSCNATTSPITSAYVIYKRPNPEGRIVTLEGTNISPGIKEEGYGMLVIFLSHKTEKNVNKKIVILSTGQMYVKEW